jgi:hypothetical protein
MKGVLIMKDLYDVIVQEVSVEKVNCIGNKNQENKKSSGNEDKNENNSENDNDSEKEKIKKSIKKAAKCCREKLLKYYNKTNNAYLIAVILDPRLKMQYFKDEEWDDELITKINQKYVFKNFCLWI